MGLVGAWLELGGAWLGTAGIGGAWLGVRIWAGQGRGLAGLSWSGNPKARTLTLSNPSVLLPPRLGRKWGWEPSPPTRDQGPGASVGSDLWLGVMPTSVFSPCLDVVDSGPGN